jgi:hypothetical protein
MAVLSLLVASCSTGTSPGGEFELSSSPQFVNRMIPGRRPTLLVTATGDIEQKVTLTVETSTGAAAMAEPAEISVGGVAEVWVEIPEVDVETPMTITVSGESSNVTRTLSVNATAVPGVDDLESTAKEIAAFFLDDLAGTVPGVPPDVAGLVNGTPVAGLLVVTHYAWFTDDAEIGLAWHVMVAPDDWAEMYVRPRGELRPTAAYRLSSWSTALAGGEVTITEIPAPSEVTR